MLSDYDSKFLFTQFCSKKIFNLKIFCWFLLNMIFSSFYKNWMIKKKNKIYLNKGKILNTNTVTRQRVQKTRQQWGLTRYFPLKSSVVLTITSSPFRALFSLNLISSSLRVGIDDCCQYPAPLMNCKQTIV